MNILKAALVLLTLTASVEALAHRPGFYKIDGNDQAVVHFAVLKECPVVASALTGKIRTFTFSDTAETSRYGYKSGFYVETHVGDDEVYVKTDVNCVPSTTSISLPATSSKLGRFSIQRLE